MKRVALAALSIAQSFRARQQPPNDHAFVSNEAGYVTFVDGVNPLACTRRDLV